MTMPFSNCLIFAVWRFLRRGGYLIMRRSRHGWWPHILWCEHLRDAVIEHYVPFNYSEHFAASHKIIFRGYVSRIDLSSEEGKKVWSSIAEEY
jgi:hypothetical protein